MLPYSLRRRTWSSLAILTVVGPLVGTGCTGDRSSAATVTSRDGIRIVESKATDADTTNGWVISPKPVLSIGVEDGAEQYQFSRVGGVVRLDDGRIAVGDGGSSQLRLYDSSGTFISATGRGGQGPGEFARFSSPRIWRASGGELLINDSGNGRINVFGSGGVYRRAIKLAAAPTGPRVFLMDVFADGSLLAMAPEGGGRLDASVVGPLPPMKFAYLRYAPNGEYGGHILDATDRPRYVHAFGTIRHFPYIPLMQEPTLVARDTAVIVYRGPGAEVEEWTAGGRQIATLRWHAGPPRTVASIWDRFVSEDLASMEGEERAQYTHFYAEPLKLPTIVPAADALLADAEGYIWARRYRLPWEKAQRWDVLAPEGQWRTVIGTPDRLNVTQIGRDFILGTHRDSLGVERVQMFTLTRGRSSEGSRPRP